MQHKIAIGCPVRNRAWVLPEYLGALKDIDYPPENIHFIFLDNDSYDDTTDLLGAFYDSIMEYDPRTELSRGKCTHEVIYTGAEHWNHGDYAHEQYANLARVRNHFLDMFLRTDADFLLSVDSDVIVPPDIVTRLLQQANRPILRWVPDPKEPGMMMCEEWGGTIVGAAISNVPNKPLDGQTPGNFMLRNATYSHPTSYPMQGTMEVDLIGAVYLIPRSVIEEGARYAPHPTGEDAPFCEAARRLGYRLLVDMDVRCEHRMVKP